MRSEMLGVRGRRLLFAPGSACEDRIDEESHASVERLRLKFPRCIYGSSETILSRKLESLWQGGPVWPPHLVQRLF